MYNSPIDIFYGQLEVQREGEVLKAVQKCGIDVDKGELVKALAYDRDQYEKGYKDAMERMRWIPVSERLPVPHVPVLTCRQSFDAKPPYIKIDTIILPHGDRSETAWLDDLHTWKTVVTHWMPLPELPKGE